MRTELAVAQELINQKQKIALAESCTGGLLAHKLTNIPGSSKFLEIALVTYSNDAKVKLLKIKPASIKKYGAVSETVSVEMAKNILKIAKSNYGIGISGIAGPTGATKNKPIGLVYICVATKLEYLCIKCQFTGTRTSIKTQAATQALKLLKEFLD